MVIDFLHRFQTTILLVFVSFVAGFLVVASTDAAPIYDGRISAGMYGWNSASGVDGMEPSMRGKLHAGQLFGGNFLVQLDARIRRDVRSAYNKTRIYELWLGWRPDSIIEVQTGRLGSRGFGGVGFLDGARYIRRIKNGYEVSAFGGVEPDLETNGIGNETQKYGVAFEFRSQTGNRWGASLLEQQYQNESDRRLLTEYMMATPRDGIFLYQNGEYDFVWRENGSDRSGFRIGNFQLSLNEAPKQSNWRFQQSFAYRRNLKPLRSLYSVSDTLFESDPRYDLSLGTNWRTTRYLNLRGDIRWQHRQSDNETGVSLSSGATISTLTTVPIYSNINYRYNDNLYYYGNGVDVSIERELFNRLTGRVDWGWESNTYTLSSVYSSSGFELTHAGTSLSYWVDQWSFSGGIEAWNTDSGKEYRWMFDTGLRIRPTGK